MTPRDWLLLYIALKGAPGGLEPVKIQKGLFLFAMESATPAQEKYTFEPYNYGPMSKAVYRDLDSLVREGLVEAIPVSGYSWYRYKATQRGLQQAREVLREQADREAARQLYDIKNAIAGRSFEDLLRDVYDRYPEYATASVFTR